MQWTDLFPTLNGIVGGVIMALVGWLVGTGRLRLGREADMYKTLWETEQTKSTKFEALSDKLTEDLRRNNEILVSTSAGLAKANEELLEDKRHLLDNNRFMKDIIEGRKENRQ